MSKPPSMTRRLHARAGRLVQELGLCGVFDVSALLPGRNGRVGLRVVGGGPARAAMRHVKRLVDGGWRWISARAGNRPHSCPDTGAGRLQALRGRRDDLEGKKSAGQRPEAGCRAVDDSAISVETRRWTQWRRFSH
jgi:hypothetical protein